MLLIGMVSVLYMSIEKMHNFNNPNELPKEMLYFTYDEFQKFLSVEKDIKFRCAW